MEGSECTCAYASVVRLGLRLSVMRDIVQIARWRDSSNFLTGVINDNKPLLKWITVCHDFSKDSRNFTPKMQQRRTRNRLVQMELDKNVVFPPVVTHALDIDFTRGTNKFHQRQADRFLH